MVCVVCLTTPHHTTVATISLEVADYTVGESEGSVMVCTAITQGQLAELAGVQLTTMDGTATARKTTLVTSFPIL